MTEASLESKDYQPVAIDVPPLFSWPFSPIAALKWLVSLMLPWGLLWLGLAIVSWFYLTPDMEQMKYLEFGWIASIWIRNAVLITLVLGGLHWWLHMRKGQGKETKFTKRWLATDDDKFLWRNQVKDNMFWSIVSGVSVWTAYEALTFWWYANGNVVWSTFSESPVYFIIMIWGVMFWSTFHFYCSSTLVKTMHFSARL